MSQMCLHIELTQVKQEKEDEKVNSWHSSGVKTQNTQSHNSANRSD